MKTRRDRGSWIFLAGLLLTGSACASNGKLREMETAWPAASAVHLRVNNQYDFPLMVLALGSGITFRMGKVLPGMAGDFELPRALVGNGPVEFIAATGDGNPPAESGRFLLALGDVVDFVIKRPTYASTATVRR